MKSELLPLVPGCIAVVHNYCIGQFLESHNGTIGVYTGEHDGNGNHFIKLNRCCAALGYPKENLLVIRGDHWGHLPSLHNILPELIAMSKELTTYGWIFEHGSNVVECGLGATSFRLRG